MAGALFVALGVIESALVASPDHVAPNSARLIAGFFVYTATTVTQVTLVSTFREVKKESFYREGISALVFLIF